MGKEGEGRESKLKEERGGGREEEKHMAEKRAKSHGRKDREQEERKMDRKGRRQPGSLKPQRRRSES